jgi:hypothetical protein
MRCEHGEHGSYRPHTLHAVSQAATFRHEKCVARRHYPMAHPGSAATYTHTRSPRGSPADQTPPTCTPPTQSAPRRLRLLLLREVTFACTHDRYCDAAQMHCVITDVDRPPLRVGTASSTADRIYNAIEGFLYTRHHRMPSPLRQLPPPAMDGAVQCSRDLAHPPPSHHGPRQSSSCDSSSPGGTGSPANWREVVRHMSADACMSCP